MTEKDPIHEAFERWWIDTKSDQFIEKTDPPVKLMCSATYTAGWLEGRGEEQWLRARLDCDTCNAGHKTLPLALWDCPECVRLRTEALHRENERLLELLEIARKFAEDLDERMGDLMSEARRQPSARHADSPTPPSQNANEGES